MSGPADYTHEELEMLVSAHALDALEPDEAAAVEAHLAGCESCRAAFAEAIETAAMLAMSAPGAEPPPALRDRILTAARSTPQEPPLVVAAGAGPELAAAAVAEPAVAPVAAPAPTRQRKRFREVFTPSRNFAAAFAIAAGLLGVLWLSERDTADQLRAERDASALVGQVLAAPGAQVVALSGPGGATGGAVLVADEHKPVVVADLLPAPPGKIWEVWTIPEGGKPTSAALMHGGDQNVVQLPASVPDGTTIAITAEPDDGTQHAAPTGQIALSGGVSPA
jgi:anti-sigma-K factor RskA